MGDSIGSWVEEYYDALRFFYWEPMHLGRRKYADARLNTFGKVSEHLRKIEVTLNHQLKQFLCLAPGSLRNGLFEEALGRQITGEFIMAGSLDDVDKTYELHNAVQPDFLFLTDDTTVAVEMKIEAKSSVTQVLKYALLALAIERNAGRKMQHFLIFLGPNGFSDLWRKGPASVDDLRRKLRDEQETFWKGHAKKFQEHESQFPEIVASLSIGFISYQTLANLLDAQITQSDGSAGPRSTEIWSAAW